MSGSESQGERKLTQFQQKILVIKHPLELSGVVSGKGLTTFQRAMTFIISSHGGYIEEPALTEIITRHADEISALSDKKVPLEPSAKLIHSNIDVRIKGNRLFRRIVIGPTRLILLNTPGADDNESSEESPASERESGSEPEVIELGASDDLGSGEEGNTEDNEDGVQVLDDQEPVPIEFPEGERFEDRIMRVFRCRNGPLKTDAIREELAESKTCEGDFQTLDFAVRVRACLVRWKLAKRIAEVGPDLWEVSSRRNRADKLPLKCKMPEPYPGAWKVKSEVTLDQLYKHVSNKP